MNLTCIFFGSMFSLVGVLFAAGKLHLYLSAWKHMPQAEKDTVNIIPLCRNIGEIILLSGIIFLLNGFFPAMQEHWFAGAMIAWLVAAGLDLWFISKSRRFRRP